MMLERGRARKKGCNPSPWESFHCGDAGVKRAAAAEHSWDVSLNFQSGWGLLAWASITIASR